MEVIIKGDPKEIAALVLAVQGRHTPVDEIMKQITHPIASELSSVQYSPIVDMVAVIAIFAITALSFPTGSSSDPENFSETLF
ncbi:MAG: hypothetical protein V8Q30_02620 [Acutalibacteraceae bacterium]